mgnify:CR=1 FL=1
MHGLDEMATSDAIERRQGEDDDDDDDDDDVHVGVHVDDHVDGGGDEDGGSQRKEEWTMGETGGEGNIDIIGDQRCARCGCGWW